MDIRVDTPAAAAKRKYRLEKYPAVVAADPAGYLWRVCKWRAKAKKLEFNIDVSDITVPEVCPILGTKLEVMVKRAPGTSPNKASVDRIDNQLGYVKGNVRVISMKANYLKNALTLPLAEKLVRYMKGEI